MVLCRCDVLFNFNVSKGYNAAELIQEFSDKKAFTKMWSRDRGLGVEAGPETENCGGLGLGLKVCVLDLVSRFRHPGNTQKPGPKNSAGLGVKPVEKPANNHTKLNSISVCHASNN